MAMVPEVKALWVEKLRNGGLSQSTGYLNDGEGFCCLGVLCEVAIEQGVPVVKTEPNDEGPGVNYDGCAEYLPDRVCEWAGLDFDPEVSHANDEGDVVSDKLSALNDDDRWSFAQIATAIEQDDDL